MSDREKDPVERAVELFVLAPIGAGLLALESAPAVLDTCVGRARSEIDRRQEEVARRVQTVRSTGEVALAFGWPRVRARIDQRIADARRKIEGVVLVRTSAPASPPATPATPVAPPTPAASTDREVAAGDTTDEAAASPAIVFSYPPRPAADAPSSDTLPIPGYDALSASQVVERLAGLKPEELDAVHAYEAAHRGRRTILGKIEQLAG